MHFIEKKGLLFMKQGSKIGIVCCSNGLRPEQAETIKMLVQILEKSGLEVDLSPYLYGDENGQAGTARERATVTKLCPAHPGRNTWGNTGGNARGTI